MLIQETKDYNLFHNIDCNRGLHEGNLKKIQKSISQTNLLKSKPILIDEKFRVIDGKHRLEVAKRMGIPVFYQMHEGIKIDDIIKLNNAVKAWSIGDYLNFYSKNGYIHYAELSRFIEKYSVDVNVALHLLNANRNSGFYKDFKEGLYQFPDQGEFMNVELRKIMIDETIEFIKKKTSGNKTYLGRVTFYCALVSFFGKENFDYEIFSKKLQYRLDLIHPCSRKEEYIKILTNVYNWKNHAPLIKQ